MKQQQWSILILAALVLALLAMTACAAQPVPAAEVAAHADEAKQSEAPAPTAVPKSDEPTVVEVSRNVGDASTSSLVINRGVTEVAQTCIDCHKEESPGIVEDWKDSRHGHASVTCLDCHQVEADSPMATQHESLVGTDTYISVLVSPKVCQNCHPQEVEQFGSSGHYRGYLQIVPKTGLHDLQWVHEGQSHPEFSDAPRQTGCMQCHGAEITLDDQNGPTPDTWPNAGIGNVYPDGGVGNCIVCHTRHKFDIAEARQPEACASCHLGPDHPDIEIFENTKHGQIFATEGDEWIWDSAPDAWEPGDYRAPTCATCHMSGIGDLSTTHNISERLYWNLWAKRSEPRNSEDPMSPLTGNAEEGRAKMEMVCESCHSPRHTEGYFSQGDDAVQLYNVAYYDPANTMLNDLKEKGLLKENPWDDEFQKIYYHLWHHQGRRARQGAMMGGPDWAHWHGFFELQQDLYELQSIYEWRLENNAIEAP